MTKEARVYTGGKMASSINGIGKTVWLHTKEVKWIKDLNVIPEII